jgi:hypothetical protein
MNANQTLIQERDVRDFHEAYFCVINTSNHLQIRQGDRESLMIEAEPSILARLETHVRNGKLEVRLRGALWDRVREAVSTSLSRPQIRYTLEVRDLDHLVLCGAYSVHGLGLRTGHLTLELQGPVDLKLDSITADSLTVQNLTLGSVELSGQVAEQTVSLSGIGRYQASRLKSGRASIALHGPGRATLWVVDELEADVRGPGIVEYRGRPTVRRSGAPLGRVVPMRVSR